MANELVVALVIGLTAAVIIGIVGIYETRMLNDDNTSIAVIPEYVVAREDTFTEIDREILEKAFANPEINSEIMGREDIVVRHVRAIAFEEGSAYDCPAGSCVSIFFRQEATGAYLHFFYNHSKDRVFELSKGENWQS